MRNTPFFIVDNDVLPFYGYRIVNFLFLTIYEPFGISNVVPAVVAFTVFTILPLVSNMSTVSFLSE